MVVRVIQVIACLEVQAVIGDQRCMHTRAGDDLSSAVAQNRFLLVSSMATLTVEKGQPEVEWWFRKSKEHVESWHEVCGLLSWTWWSGLSLSDTLWWPPIFFHSDPHNKPDDSARSQPSAVKNRFVACCTH